MSQDIKYCPQCGTEVEDNVKKELDSLSGDKINVIMKKHSISGLLPLKIAKITKLIENVPLTDLKIDLAEYGVARYKIKYGSNFKRKNR